MIGFDKYGKKTELEIKSLKDKRLINIDLSSKWFFHAILAFNTYDKEIRKFKEAVAEVKKAHLTPFWRPVMDPSIEEGNVVYKKGNKPATGYSFNRWCQMTSEMPAVEGKTWKVGTEYQYYAFLVWLINQLVEGYGWSVKEAIEAVVYDSKELGHYNNSKKAMHDFETTGSRESCGVYDLANTFKIIDCSNTEARGFWLAGGDWSCFSYNCPLAELIRNNYVGIDYIYCVGWLVLS